MKSVAFQKVSQKLDKYLNIRQAGHAQRSANLTKDLVILG
jgi:hypothetical protein